FIPNKGGSTCLAKLKGKAKQLGAFNFAELVVNECQVMLLPSNLFFYGNDFVRIGLGRTNFKDALHTLDQFLCKWKLHFFFHSASCLLYHLYFDGLTHSSFKKLHSVFTLIVKQTLYFFCK
ncbi:hypothetical protein RFI_39889, partial [Reticulomyxa filosa]